MPRPKHPIREHFTEIPSNRRNGSIRCNYCSKEQSAGNPQRCQAHLDECTQYGQIIAALDAGEPLPLVHQSPYENPQHGSFYSLSKGEERMTEDQIIQALQIDQSTYIQIERDLDSEMGKLNISGAGLLTQGGHNLLKQAFYQLNKAWADVLHEVAEQDKTTGMTSMAYLVERKRRNGQPPNASPARIGLQRRVIQRSIRQSEGNASSDEPVASSPIAARIPASPIERQPPGPFGLTLIIAERVGRGGAFVICRPLDLIDEEIEAEEITVNDVKFVLFLNLLQQDEDVMFNANDDDKIMHTFVGGRSKTVSNEVVWRIALEQMHKTGANPMVFKIFKRYRGPPA